MDADALTIVVAALAGVVVMSAVTVVLMRRLARDQNESEPPDAPDATR